jgi:hypothetical protein
LDANYNHTSTEPKWWFSDPVTGDKSVASAAACCGWNTTLDPNGVDAGFDDPFPSGVLIVAAKRLD